MSLDIGCGHDFRKHSAHGSVNIDVKKPNWHVANFIQADAQSLPLRSECVDEAVCHQVIEHVKHPLLLMEEAKRVLKKNGAITLSTPNPLHWRRILRACRNKPLQLGFQEHIYAWTPHEISNLATQAGLTVTHIWHETPSTLETAKGFRYRIDRYVGKLLPNAVGKRHLMVTAQNGSSNES